LLVQIVDSLLDNVGTALWTLAIGVFIVYGFMSAMGGFSPVSVFILLGALAVMVTVYLLRRARVSQEEGQHAMMETVQEGRERRGF
jgi:hypothetical protein